MFNDDEKNNSIDSLDEDENLLEDKEDVEEENSSNEENQSENIFRFGTDGIRVCATSSANLSFKFRRKTHPVSERREREPHTGFLLLWLQEFE